MITEWIELIQMVNGVVEKLNAKIRSQIGNMVELFPFEMVVDESVVIVRFLDVIIWESDNDNRPLAFSVGDEPTCMMDLGEYISTIAADYINVLGTLKLD